MQIPFMNFLQKSGPKTLTEPMREVLQSRFRVDNALLEQWQFSEKKGHYAGRTVKFVRIFDPQTVASSARTSLSYDTLSSQPNAVLFDGHLEKDGMAHLVDRRSRQRTAAQP